MAVSAILRGCLISKHLKIDESKLIRGLEWPIHREGTEAILMALADLIVDVGIIRALLEDEDEEEEEDA